MSDEDNFVKALRDIDCQRDPPLHCTGHFHRMRIHGYIERKLVNGEHGSTWAWCLTDEGKLRAFPERGRLRVPVERVRAAINNEGASWLQASTVLHKTFAARDRLRNAWYTPDYAKAIPKPEPEETPEKRLVKALRPFPTDVALGIILAITAPPPDELLDGDDMLPPGNRFARIGDDDDT